MEILKKKEGGMTAFNESLKLTTDGTKHKANLGSLFTDTEE